MDLGLAQLNSHNSKSGKATRSQLVQKLQIATIAFSRNCQRVTSVIAKGIMLHNVLDNVSLAKTVITKHGANSGVLELINGREGQLCQLMGWNKLPVVTAENKEELEQEIVTELDNTAASGWTGIQSFFSMIVTVFAEFIAAARALLENTSTVAEDEIIRLTAIDDEVAVTDIAVSIAPVKQGDNTYATLSSLLAALKEFAGIAVPLSTITSSVDAIIAYSNDTTDDKQLDVGSDNITAAIAAIKQMALSCTEIDAPLTLGAHGICDVEDAIEAIQALMTLLETCDTDVVSATTMSTKLTAAVEAIANINQPDETIIEQVRIVQDGVQVAIDVLKSEVAIITTLINNLVSATAAIVETDTDIDEDADDEGVNKDDPTGDE